MQSQFERKKAERYGSKVNAQSAAASSAAPRPAPPRTAKAAPEAYYDFNKGKYWFQNDRGEWVFYPQSALRTFLIDHGIFAGMREGEVMSDVDRQIMRYQRSNDIFWGGILAGYEAGLHEVCNTRILVTRGPKLIKPAAGKWPTLKRFFSELLGKQSLTFYAWLKAALDSLRAGPEFRPGQALVIAGGHGDGKSLCQNLITELLGNRSAKPFRYIKGRTEFNNELFASEHLMVEDEQSSTDPRARSAVGAALKNMLVGETQSFHPKGRDAITLRPFWRITITLNDNAEDLLVLPPMRKSLAEKFILFKSSPAKMPYADGDLAGRKAFREKLSREMPAFLHWLRRWRVPAKLSDKRYGVATYHNPEIWDKLYSLNPETHLLEIIDEVWIWDADTHYWVGTASALQTLLTEKKRSKIAEQLLYWHGACGSLLAKIEERCSETVKSTGRKDHAVVWSIARPDKRPKKDSLL